MCRDSPVFVWTDSQKIWIWCHEKTWPFFSLARGVIWDRNQDRMIDSFEFTSAFCREISQHLPRRKVPQLDGIAMICFFQVVLFCSRNEVEIRNSKKVPEGCRKHSPQSQWFLRFKEDLPGCKTRNTWSDPINTWSSRKISVGFQLLIWLMDKILWST